MRPKRNFSFGSLRNSSPLNYIHHENVDNSIQFPTLKNVVEHSEAKLCDLPKLQIETEKIMSILGYRMMNLKSLLDGSPLKTENGLISSSKKSTQYLQFIALPNEKKTSTTEHTTLKTAEELVVKSDPDKPLTLIITPNGPSTRRTSQSVNTKRKLLDEAPVSETKRQKFLPVNDKNEKDAKPNYEIPNKFWELMEPYCTEINDEHIKTLESYIQSYEGDAKYYELPEVDGVQDNLSENKSVKSLSHKRHTNHIDDTNLNGFVDSKGSMELSSLLKKIDNEIRKPLSQTKILKTFPLALTSKMSEEIDELITMHKSKVKDLKNGISSEASGVSKSLARQLKVSNSYKIEKHVKKSMDDLGMCNFNLPFIPKLEPQFDLCKDSEEQGIAKSNEADIIDPIVLTSDDYVTLNLPNSLNNNNNRKPTIDSVKEDKALLGLRRRQAELKLVSESNLGMLRRLLVAARRDMKRQDIERRLAVADADVIDSYNVIESYRPTHRPPLKKDRDVAYKAIKDRQKILKELETFDSEFL